MVGKPYLKGLWEQRVMGQESTSGARFGPDDQLNLIDAAADGLQTFRSAATS